jgi:membrane protease YdiL (CAAX protease family)
MSTAVFFVAAWTISTLAILPSLLAQHGVLAGPAERYAPLIIIAVLSPTLAAMLAARLEPGGAGIRGVFRPLRDWSVSLRWYAIAFCLSPIALFVGTALYKIAGGPGQLSWWYPPHTPDRLVAIIMLPLCEEIGWRGFALPRLERRFSPLTASLLLGMAWGIWHIPMFFVAGAHVDRLMVEMVLFLVPGSILFSWIFHRTRGSLTVAIVMHMGIHINNSMIALPGNPLPFHVHFVAVLVLAALLIADRKSWLRNN